jgi:hypothetical protein
VDDLVKQLSSLAAAVSGLEAVRDEWAALPLLELNGTVVGLGERVHAHEQDLKEVRRKLERMGGSVLDGMALDRRLRTIEDRILDSTGDI